MNFKKHENPKAHSLQWFRQDKLLYVSIFTFGIIIYALTWPSEEHLTNPDGVTYIKTAECFLNNEILAAFEITRWLCLAILATLLSKLNISLENCFYNINMFFFSALPLIFIHLYKTITRSRKNMIIVILSTKISY